MTIDIQLVEDSSIIPDPELFRACSFVAVGTGVELVLSVQLLIVGLYVSHSVKPLKVLGIAFLINIQNLITN